MLNPSEYLKCSYRRNTTKDLREVRQIVGRCCAEDLDSCPHKDFLQAKATENGFFIMREALMNSNVDVAKVLLKFGAAVNNPYDAPIKTPLYFAAMLGYVDVVGVLLAQGANVNCSDYRGKTALHVAATNGHDSVVSTLLKHDKTNVNIQDIQGNTALHVAVEKGCGSVVSALLNHVGTDVSIRDIHGSTALHIAARKGHDGMVLAMLKSARTDVSIKDTRGYIALHVAAEKGHDGVVSALLNHAATDVSTTDNVGQTALHLAAVHGSEDMVRNLLARGSNVNYRSESRRGTTALHLAAAYNRPNTVKVLLGYGADLNTCTCGRGHSFLYFDIHSRSRCYSDDVYMETLDILRNHIATLRCLEHPVTLNHLCDDEKRDFEELTRLCRNEMELLETWKLEGGPDLSGLEMLCMKNNELCVLVLNKVLREFFVSGEFNRFRFFSNILEFQFKSAQRRVRLLQEASMYIIGIFHIAPGIPVDAITAHLSESDLWNFNLACEIVHL